MTEGPFIHSANTHLNVTKHDSHDVAQTPLTFLTKKGCMKSMKGSHFPRSTVASSRCDEGGARGGRGKRMKMKKKEKKKKSRRSGEEEE